MDDQAKAKKLTRQSIQLMTISARGKRGSIVPVDISEMSTAGATPAAKTLEKVEEDAETRQMLAESYREVTGRQLPDTMSTEDAMAELRVLQAAAWSKLMEPPPTDDADEATTEKPKKRISLRMGGVTVRADPNHGAMDLEESTWDESLLEMLKDSYREVTGRSMPEGMAPGDAYAELRKLQVKTWQEQGLAELIEETEVEARQHRQTLARIGGPNLEFDLDELDSVRASSRSQTVSIAPASSATAKSTPPASASESGAPGAEPPIVKPSATTVKFAEPEGGHDKDEDSPLRRDTSTSSVGFRSVSYSNAPTKVFEGWLAKKGEGLLASEKRRFFCLHETGEMHYYTSHDLTDCKGRFSLAGLTFSDVILSANGLSATCLTIKTKGRSWQLTAPSDGQAKAWLKNMHAVISNLSGEPAPLSGKMSVERALSTSRSFSQKSR